MKFLSHMRSRSKLTNDTPEAQIYNHHEYQPSHPNGRRYAPAPALPVKALKQIFIYICPHTQDNTYISCEESGGENECMLCDTRDLAQCAKVNRLWANVAQDILYHSVRLDAVHYCERENEISPKKERRSFLQRSEETQDPTQQRLAQFSRTVREREYLATLVHFFKMPYMTRETCKADLARTVSVLPNLRFVDLPEGFFTDDSSSSILRQELALRCPEIRRMKYAKGSEPSFSSLPRTRYWQNLEILELTGLRCEQEDMLYVLASLSALHELKLSDIPALDDGILIPNTTLPPFPPVSTLALENTPAITSSGLVAYLSRPESRESLTHLKLSETGVLPQTLHEVLANAPHIATLSIEETVSRAFPLSPVPPLASRSLRSLQYEILPSTNASNATSESYYTYVSTSLLSKSLPALTELFAYSPSLPDLLLPPPVAEFAVHGKTNRFSAYSAASSTCSQTSHTPPAHEFGLTSPLLLYTKSPVTPEVEWFLTTIEPAHPVSGRRESMSSTRPVSLSVGAKSLSPYSPRGRKTDSILAGNDYGGLLAIPTEDSDWARPKSSLSPDRSSKSSKKYGNEWWG